MTAPTLDGAAVVNQAWSGNASSTVTISTTKANDLLVLWIAYENGGTSVPTMSVSDTAGLTWTKRKSINVVGTAYVALDVWTAPAPSILTNNVITVTASASIDDACIIAQAVNGLGALATPFDTNASLPASASGSPGYANVTWSTSNASDLAFGAVGVYGSGTAWGTLPAGWTQLALASNGGGIGFCQLWVGYQSLTSVQTGDTFQTSANGGTHGACAIVDALAGTSSGGSSSPSNSTMATMGVG